MFGFGVVGGVVVFDHCGGDEGIDNEVWDMALVLSNIEVFNIVVNSYRE